MVPSETPPAAAPEVAAPRRAEPVPPPVWPAASDAAERRAKPPYLDRRIFSIMTTLLAVQLILLVTSLAFQFHNYATGIALAQQSGASTDSVSLILIYSRAWDFAVVKTSALFLGFLVFYSGTLFVLRTAEASYELSVMHGSQLSLNLKSSSPGLIMITLGAVLVALVLYNKSAVELQVSSGPAATAITATSASSGATAVTTTTTTVKPTRPTVAAPGPGPAEDNRVPKLLDAD